MYLLRTLLFAIVFVLASSGSGECRSIAETKALNKTRTNTQFPPPSTVKTVYTPDVGPTQTASQVSSLRVSSTQPTGAYGTSLHASESWMKVMERYPWVLGMGVVAVVLFIIVLILTLVIVTLLRKQRGYRPVEAAKSTRAPAPPPDSPSGTTSTTDLSTPPANGCESLKYDQPYGNVVNKPPQVDVTKLIKPRQPASKPAPPARKSDTPTGCAVDEANYLLPKNALEQKEAGKTKSKIGGKYNKKKDAEPKLDEANYLIITHSESEGKQEEESTGYKAPTAQNIIQELKKNQGAAKSLGVSYDIPHAGKLAKSLSQGDITGEYKQPRSSPETSHYVDMHAYNIPNGTGSAISDTSGAPSYDVPLIRKEMFKSNSQGNVYNSTNDSESCYVNHRPVIFQ